MIVSIKEVQEYTNKLMTKLQDCKILTTENAESIIIKYSELVCIRAQTALNFIYLAYLHAQEENYEEANKSLSLSKISFNSIKDSFKELKNSINFEKKIQKFSEKYSKKEENKSKNTPITEEETKKRGRKILGKYEDLQLYECNLLPVEEEEEPVIIMKDVHEEEEALLATIKLMGVTLDKKKNDYVNGDLNAQPQIVDTQLSIISLYANLLKFRLLAGEYKSAKECIKNIKKYVQLEDLI